MVLDWIHVGHAPGRGTGFGSISPRLSLADFGLDLHWLRFLLGRFSNNAGK